MAKLVRIPVPPRRQRVSVLPPGKLSRREWAQRINDKWKAAATDMLAAIFAIGRDLITAKEGPDKLPHGEFIALVEGDLDFHKRVAQMFMAVARDRRLTKANTYSLLPPHHHTLYKITRLTDDVLDRLVGDGTITPDVTYAAINKVLRTERVKCDEQRVLNLVPVVGKFRTIVLDPAWEYDWLSLAGRAKPGYAMQKPEQLRAMDVRAWADDESGCHLYVWTTNNFMAEACKLIAHWGFQHRTLITWIKPPPFGLGSYFRNSTEHVLFATLGETTTRHAAASIPTHFEASRGEHSEKPECFYDIVRACSYPPYGEGNQRESRPDFTNLFVSRDEVARAAAAE